MLGENASDEKVIDPHRVIVDSHHHLIGPIHIDSSSPLHGKAAMLGVDRSLLVDEYCAAVDGCNVAASVVIQAGVMHRKDGREDLRPVGETEFLNGQAAMAASGTFGDCRVGDGIISHGDLLAGDRVQAILEAHMAAAPARFRGVRQTAGWDRDHSIFGWLYPHVDEGLYINDAFRAGFSVLRSLGLVFDAFILPPQIPDVVDLASRFADTPIVVEHLAVPLGIGRFDGQREEEFPQWREGMRALAERENVFMKIGGLGSYLSGFRSFMAQPPFCSQMLAEEWRPYVETAIEIFGADRCMFNSDLPTNRAGSFVRLSNAYKIMTDGCSETEKDAIFSRTAAKFYRLTLPNA